jgi:hypothetical protein
MCVCVWCPCTVCVLRGWVSPRLALPGVYSARSHVTPRLCELRRPWSCVCVCSVHVTLSRPEELWKSACKADSVGCMIGFYIVTCDHDREAKFNDGRGGLLGETAFVPMHQGVTPQGCVRQRCMSLPLD